MGLGIGFCYLTPIKCGWEYFPDNKGMVSGIIMLAFGMGSFIFSFIALAVVNPNQEDPEVETTGGRLFEPDSY
jgi:MFS transporter, OFA family, oxalate/formate antiporter